MGREFRCDGVRLFRAGGLGMLGTLIKVVRTVAPREHELYPSWQGMQYMRSMFDGRAKLEPLDNNRYPGMRWTTARDVLLTRQVGEESGAQSIARGRTRENVTILSRQGAAITVLLARQNSAHRRTSSATEPETTAAPWKAARPANLETLPNRSSMRRNWLNFATRSLRQPEPVLM